TYSSWDNVRVVTAEGRELWRATPFTGGAFCLAWCPDGRWVAAGSSDGAVGVVGVLTGIEGRRIDGIVHNGGLAWSPDSTRLAVAGGSSGGSAAMWVVEASSGTVEKTFRTETSNVWGVDWSPDGTRLAVGSSSSPARILDAHSGGLL